VAFLDVIGGPPRIGFHHRLRFVAQDAGNGGDVDSVAQRFNAPGVAVGVGIGVLGNVHLVGQIGHNLIHAVAGRAAGENLGDSVIANAKSNVPPETQFELTVTAGKQKCILGFIG
jgi:hypothetical protein